jgi:hypothetical protein
MAEPPNEFTELPLADVSAFKAEPCLGFFLPSAPPTKGRWHDPIARMVLTKR